MKTLFEHLRWIAIVAILWLAVNLVVGCSNEIVKYNRSHRAAFR